LRSLQPHKPFAKVDTLTEASEDAKDHSFSVLGTLAPLFPASHHIVHMSWSR
jgi:hypothetical protein